MSHIPSPAMPHAKTHEEPPERKMAKVAPAPGSRWIGAAVFGVLALGGVAAVLLARQRGDGSRPVGKKRSAGGGGKRRKRRAA